MEFGELKDVTLREVWGHEAHDFTPWLATNMECLSEAIGVPLELEGTEVAVERFSADIVAHNPADGSCVLIENQLEGSDHTHLGQILTYLAGVDGRGRDPMSPYATRLATTPHPLFLQRTLVSRKRAKIGARAGPIWHYAALRGTTWHKAPPTCTRTCAFEGPLGSPRRAIQPSSREKTAHDGSDSATGASAV